MAFNSQALGCCLITDESKAEGASCFVWVSCCLLGPLEAVNAWGCSAWQNPGIGASREYPQCLPACLGAGGASWGTACKHGAGDWRWHWCWCEDVASPRGWGTVQTLLGFGSWGQPDLIRAACHIMVRFILLDALPWSLFSRGRGFAFASLHIRVPRLGWTESGTLCKTDGCSALAGGEQSKGTEVFRWAWASWCTQPGPGCAALCCEPGHQRLWWGTGQESYSTDHWEVGWMFFSSQISFRNML